MNNFALIYYVYASVLDIICFKKNNDFIYNVHNAILPNVINKL